MLKKYYVLFLESFIKLEIKTNIADILLRKNIFFIVKHTPQYKSRFYRFPNRRHGNKAHKRLFPTKMLKTKAQGGNNQAAVSSVWKRIKEDPSVQKPF